VKILNLYAGIGGNRKLWEGHEVTAVEYEPYIAEAYNKLFPQDTVVIGDAHQYLLNHFKEFDFIWSSPPCPTHSRLSTGLAGWGIHRYPDMSLYQEIIFLKHFFKGRWLVENVEPYYGVLIQPRMTLDRHFFWANFNIPKSSGFRQYTGEISNATVGQLTQGLDIELPPGTKNARKLLRNAVDPKLGLHILQAALKQTKQESML
jgi:DNA (cytosine-5)-methyltransferase 1